MMETLSGWIIKYDKYQNVLPRRDVVEHTLDDCMCGPVVQWMTSWCGCGNFSLVRQVVHQAMDGRQ